MICPTDAGLDISQYNTIPLHNIHTYYIASLILVSQDLEIEESGQKAYSVPKIVL